MFALVPSGSMTFYRENNMAEVPTPRSLQSTSLQGERRVMETTVKAKNIGLNHLFHMILNIHDNILRYEYYIINRSSEQI